MPPYQKSSENIAEFLGYADCGYCEFVCPSEPSKVLLGQLAHFIAVLIQLSGRSIWTYMAI